MSSKVVDSPSQLHRTLAVFIQNSQVQHTLLILILINAVLLGLETVPAVARYAYPLWLLDKVLLTVFVIEIGIRIFVSRLAFFKDPWGVFDFVVVAIALVPASGPFAVLRALRVFRVLRVLTFVPSMRRIVGALVQSLNGMTSIALVLLLIFYVAAVIATNLFSTVFPELFGNLLLSFYTLFQIMTLDSWSSGITRPAMEQFPYAWLFFIPFVLIATFTMLNLFIAVIVNAVQSFDEEEAPAAPEETEHQQLLRQMQQMQQELQALRQVIEDRKS